jgi:TetR/AcrR family transcriptional regulator, regulator of autoinduction and epiphytic fitness
MSFGRGRRRGADADRERIDVILPVALREFAGHGFTEARVERIARCAQVSTATLYKLFPSKAELFTAAIERGLQDATSIRIGPGDVSPIVELVYCARAYAELLERVSMRALARTFFSEVRPSNPAVACFGPVLRQAVEARFAPPLLRCAAEDLIDVSRPNLLAATLMGPIEHQCLLHALAMGDDSYAGLSGREIADEAVRTLLSRFGRNGAAFPKREELDRTPAAA